jgi:hypothetical protein
VAAAFLAVPGIAWAPWETMSALAVNDVVVCRNAASFYFANFEAPADAPPVSGIPVGFVFTLDPAGTPPDKYSSPPLAVPAVPLLQETVPFPDGVDGLAYLTNFSGWVPFSSAVDPNAAAPYDQITLVAGYPDEFDFSADKFYDIGDCYLLPMTPEVVNLSKPDKTLGVRLLSATSPVPLAPSDLVASTIRFGASGTEASPVKIKIRELNDDGVDDLLLQFRVGDTGITCDALTGRLTGQTGDGRQFIGTSKLTIDPCQYP